MKATLTVPAACERVPAAAVAASAAKSRAIPPRSSGARFQPRAMLTLRVERNMRPDSGLVISRDPQRVKARLGVRVETTACSGWEAPVRDTAARHQIRLRALRGLFDGLVEVGPGARDERRPDALRDALLRDHALADVAPGRQLEHDVEQGALDDRAEAARAGLARERLLGDLPQPVLGEDELDVVVAEEALILLHERILRLGEDLYEILLAQLMHRRDDREAADELGDEAEVEQVLRHDLGQQLRRFGRMLRADLGAEPDRVL